MIAPRTVVPSANLGSFKKSVGLHSVLPPLALGWWGLWESVRTHPFGGWTNRICETQVKSQAQAHRHTPLGGKVISEASNREASEATMMSQQFGSGKLHQQKTSPSPPTQKTMSSPYSAYFCM